MEIPRDSRGRVAQSALRKEGLKYCVGRKRVLPISEYATNAGRYDSLSVLCTSCHRDYAGGYTRRPGRKKLNAERALAAWHAKSPEQKAEVTARRKEKREYLAKYSISPEEYDAILDAQGGGCAMCEKTPEANGRRLAVDHDHACCPGDGSCGECVRGLLCTSCNVWLGYLEDSAWVAIAEEYLARHIRFPHLNREIERLKRSS